MIKQYLPPSTPILLITLLLSLSGCDGGTESSRAQHFNAKLPQPISLLQAHDSRIAATCATGGILMLHGLDYNQDGQLGPYERLETEIVCNPSIDLPKGQGVAMQLAPHQVAGTLE